MMLSVLESQVAEWVRLISCEVRSSRRSQCKIAGHSWEIARVFASLDSNLVDHGFSSSLLSRMCSGRDLQEPRYEKVVVLKLALLSLDDPSYREWTHERRQAVLLDAKAFAGLVCDAATRHSRSGVTLSVDALSSRQEHTVELLGAYGEDLLRRASVGLTPGQPEAKLALLHRLADNPDDARYWMGQAIALDSEYVYPQSAQEAFTACRCYAEKYQRQSKSDIAFVYLKLAADSGDAIASYQLGQMSELRGDRHEAVGWYLRAEELGYPDGRLRAEALRPSQSAA